MAKPLSGLSGIAGYQVLIDEQSQATPEDRMGGTADPKHQEVGETAKPYPWQAKETQAASMHGPYGPENQLLFDFEYWTIEPAGMVTDDPTFDRTPSTGAAPWPKGIASGPVPGETPDDIADQLTQSTAIHGINLGGSLKAVHQLDALQDDWAQLYEVNPGHTLTEPPGRQMMSSGALWGTRDRTQSFARQNEYGFDSKHMMRRYARGPIPGNTYWMRPGGRPLVKSFAGPARPPIGPDSPFAGNDLGAAFSYDGAVLQNVPREYVPPPTPQLASATQADNGSDAIVEWY